MPNYAGADWSPIADAIKGFGTGYANVALKRLELDRQLGKDIYDAAQKESATRLNKAKAEDQELLTAGREQLTEYFDPAQFSPQQLSSIGADALLGSKSVQDALKGADVALTTGLRREQYDNGNPATKLSVALNKVATPYQLDSDTGAVVNKLDGSVEIPEVMKTPVATRGTKGIVSPGDVSRAFQYYEEVDEFGQKVKKLRRDFSREKAFYEWCDRSGIMPTRAALGEYMAKHGEGNERNAPVAEAAAGNAASSPDGDGILQSALKMVEGLFSPSQEGSSPAPAQTPAPAPNVYKELQGLPVSSQQECMAFIEAFKNNEISEEQLRKILMGYGVK